MLMRKFHDASSPRRGSGLALIGAGLLVGMGLLLCLVALRAGHHFEATADPRGAAAQVADHAARGLSPELAIAMTPASPPHQPAPRQENTPRGLKDLAIEFQEGQSNIFFDEAAFLSHFSMGGRRRIDAVAEELRRVDALAALPGGTRFAESRPKVFRERMAMIDLLSGYLRHDLGADSRKAALDALTNAALSSIPRGASDATKRALLSEKYECVQLLAQFDREQALRLIAQLTNSKLKQQLLPAVATGFRMGGMGEKQAMELVSSL